MVLFIAHSLTFYHSNSDLLAKPLHSTKLLFVVTISSIFGLHAGLSGLHDGSARLDACVVLPKSNYECYNKSGLTCGKQ